MCRCVVISTIWYQPADIRSMAAWEPVCRRLGRSMSVSMVYLMNRRDSHRFVSVSVSLSTSTVSTVMCTTATYLRRLPIETSGAVDYTALLVSVGSLRNWSRGVAADYAATDYNCITLLFFLCMLPPCWSFWLLITNATMDMDQELKHTVTSHALGGLAGCQITSRFYLKRRSLEIFWRASP